jgi:hypothetical protein
MHRLHKARLPIDSKWVTTRSGNFVVYAGRAYLSAAFEEFAKQNFGPYRYQAHSKFITVLFERESDAAWMKLMI